MCGDGVLTNSVTECDDGNTATEDGCDDSCMIEEGWICSGAPSDCTECGNGVLEALHEECDDGNLVALDGCSPTCKIESDCGNGSLDGDEECDDNNRDKEDGCSEKCIVENGWQCEGEPSKCKNIKVLEGTVTGFESILVATTAVGVGLGTVVSTLTATGSAATLGLVMVR